VLTEPKLRATSCAVLTSTDLTRADLSGADLRLAYLDGATLENAILIRTDLRYANMVGSNFSGADMRGALMGGGVDLTGANFLGAILSGADLKGAKIQAADFYGADLQAARLVFAQAQGANFQGAKMQGASLGAAKLQGADLTDADVSAADFGNAAIWVSKPPSPAQSNLADFSAIAIKALEIKDLTSLKDLRKSLKQPKVADKIAKLIERIGTTTSGSEWSAGDEATGWASLKQSSLASDAAARIDKTAIYLARVSCESAHSDGTVASGVIRRAVDQPAKSSPAVLMKRLKGNDCPAYKNLTEPLVLSLAATIERLTPAVQEVAAETPAQANTTTTAATTTSP